MQQEQPHPEGDDAADDGQPAERRAQEDTLAARVKGVEVVPSYSFIPDDVLSDGPSAKQRIIDGSFDGALVLVQGYRHPDYASAAAYNPVDLRGAEPVYAWDRSPEVRRAVLLAYVDRPVWVVEGPTVTGAGYRVARGPLRAARLLSEPERGATTPTGPRAMSAEGSL